MLLLSSYAVIVILLHFLLSNALTLSQALLNASVAHPPYIDSHGILLGYGVEVAVEAEAYKEGKISIPFH